MHFPTNMADGVSLNVSKVEVTAKTLILSYEVTNDTDYCLYLINRLFHREGSGGFKVDTNLVYSDFEPPHILHLRKQMLAVPEEIDVETPEVPYVTSIAAGKSFQETIRLQLPIELHSPYRFPPPPPATYEVTQLVFSLGYLVADDTVSVEEVTLADGTEQQRIHSGDVSEHQRLKQLDPIPATLSAVITA